MKKVKYYVTLDPCSPREVIAPLLSVFVLTLTGPTFSLLFFLLLALCELSLHQALDCGLTCSVARPVTLTLTVNVTVTASSCAAHSGQACLEEQTIWRQVHTQSVQADNKIK